MCAPGETKSEQEYIRHFDYNQYCRIMLSKNEVICYTYTSITALHLFIPTYTVAILSTASYGLTQFRLQPAPFFINKRGVSKWGCCYAISLTKRVELAGPRSDPARELYVKVSIDARVAADCANAISNILAWQQGKVRIRFVSM